MLLPSGKMEQPLYIVLEDGRCYCQVADGIANMYIVRRWQMLLPSGKTICSRPHMLQKEEDDLSKELTRCKYPTRAINRVKMKMRTPAQN